MTDTTAPSDSGLIRKAASAVVAMVASIITSTANAIASHYDKFINAVLGAAFAITVTWWTGYLNKAAAPVPAKTVEIVRTVPSVLDARVADLADSVKRLEGKVDALKPKAKGKK